MNTVKIYFRFHKCTIFMNCNNKRKTKLQQKQKVERNKNFCSKKCSCKNKNLNEWNSHTTDLNKKKPSKQLIKRPLSVFLFLKLIELKITIKNTIKISKNRISSAEKKRISKFEDISRNVIVLSYWLRALLVNLTKQK